MSEKIVLMPLLPSETSNALEKLGTFAHIDMALSEFRDIVLNQKVFKLMLNNNLFGIISVTKEPLAKIRIWLSEKESLKMWTEAIKITVSHTFKAPEVFKIKWQIVESNKEMIIAAKGCGFEKEGEHKHEGPNRQTMISFGLSRNGDSPKNSLSSKAETEIEALKKRLEAKNADLKITNETIADLLKKIASLEKDIREENAKRIQAENDLLLLKEKTTELEAIIKQQNQENVQEILSQLAKLEQNAAKPAQEKKEEIKNPATDQKADPAIEEKPEPAADPEAEEIKKVLMEKLGKTEIPPILTEIIIILKNRSEIKEPIGLPELQRSLNANKPQGIRYKYDEVDKAAETLKEIQIANTDRKDSIKIIWLIEDETKRNNEPIQEETKAISEIKTEKPPESVKKSEQPIKEDGNNKNPSKTQTLFWTIADALRQIAIKSNSFEIDDFKIKILTVVTSINEEELKKELKEFTGKGIIKRWSKTNFYTIFKKPLEDLYI